MRRTKLVRTPYRLHAVYSLTLLTCSHKEDEGGEPGLQVEVFYDLADEEELSGGPVRGGVNN
jgi:hypothetical protein